MGSCHCWDGRNKCRLCLLSPHLSQRSSPFPTPLWFCCDINCFYSCHDNVEHTTLGLAGLLLSCSTEVLRTHARRRAGRDGEVCSLWRRESTGRRARQQPHLLPIDFLPNPCTLQSIHQVTLPSYST